MNKENAICPMFIGLQYHEHNKLKSTLSRGFIYSTGPYELDFTELVVGLNGVSMYMYDEHAERDALNVRAYDFHVEFQQVERVREQRIRDRRYELKSKMLRATLGQLKNAKWRYDSEVSNTSLYFGRQETRRLLSRKLVVNTTYAAIISRAMADEIVSPEELANALNYIRERNSDTAYAVYEKLQRRCTSLEIHMCDSCGMCEVDGGFTTVHNGVYVCGSCLESYVEDCIGEWIPRDDAFPIYTSLQAWRRGDPYTYCLYDVGCNDYYYYESGNCFFDDQDDVYELEEFVDGDGLDSYHNSSRRAFFAEVAADKSKPCLGVELEVYCNDSRFKTVRNIRRTYRREDLILEKDGSLDDDSGFEIITRPMGRTEWASFGPDLLQKLRNEDVVGFNAPTDTGTYGIHVNLHRRWLSPLAEARIMMFLCARENRQFVRAIAQRREIYDPSINIGDLETYQQKIKRIGGCGNNMFRSTNGGEKYAPKIYGVGKYAPVNWKDSIAEFRIFQSTLNTGSFMKNLEFVWALVEWTKPTAATGTTWMYRDFVMWLNTPANRKEYPYLTKYLSKKSFPLQGDDDPDPVDSEWADLMVKPDTQCHDEGCAA